MSNNEIKIAKLVKTKAPVQFTEPSLTLDDSIVQSDVTIEEKKKILNQISGGSGENCYR